MSDTDGALGFLAGLIFGAAAGGLLALLFAPQPGEQTRQRIKESSIELRDKAAEASAKAYEQAQEVTARSRIALEERVADLEAAMAEGRKSGDKMKKDLTTKLDEARKPAASDS
jgi:gas vesicle protein